MAHCALCLGSMGATDFLRWCWSGSKRHRQSSYATHPSQSTRRMGHPYSSVLGLFFLLLCRDEVFHDGLAQQVWRKQSLGQQEVVELFGVELRPQRRLGVLAQLEHLGVTIKSAIGLPGRAED